ncbi:MAG: DUF3088 domain-containing protein [Marinicaulis sp.]|nr:DUF3088 domain-containing protein [Marinicaulis sp.]
MTKDQLFLLAPGFEDNNRREYCPECAEMWGLLAYYPAIRESLEIHYEPLAHPRGGLTSLLGEGNWNCPTLVIADGADAGESATVRTENGRQFLDNARDIGKYFAHKFGTATPRGS